MDPLPSRAFVVHGEPAPAEAFAEDLRTLGIRRVDVPEAEDKADL